MRKLALGTVVIITAVVTALLTSLFWIAAYNLGGQGSSSSAEVVVREDEPGLVVGPSGLAVPVAGVRADQLTDTYSQARAGGARVHDAIDIIAPRGHAGASRRRTERSKSCFFSRGGGGITAYVRSPDRPLDLLLRPSQRLCAGPRAKARASAAAIRSAPSAAPATPIPPGRTSISRSTAWARTIAGVRAARSIPTRSLPERAAAR